MAHIISDLPETRAVPEEWLAANARLNDYAVRVSNNHGIGVKIGPAMALESGTAQYDPRTKTIEINSGVVAPGLTPDEIHPSDPLFRARRPLLLATLMHELAHDYCSLWTPRTLIETAPERFRNPRKVEVLVALEESRCEMVFGRRYAEARSMFPVIMWDLLLREFKGGDDPYSASISTALVLMRRQTGVISAAEAAPFRRIIEEQLTAEQVDRLIELGVEYHDIYFSKYNALPVDEMDSIATRWLEVLGLDAEAETGGCVLAAHSHGEGEGGDEDGGEDGDGAAGSGTAARMREAAAAAKHERAMRGTAKAVRLAEERAAEDRKADAERSEAAGAEHRKVFDEKHVGDGGTAGRRSPVQMRNPTPAMRGAGTLLARRLAAARLVEPHRTKIAMRQPGKRLRGRGAVQRRVQEARGQVATAKQWEGTKRALTDEIPVRVGVAVDVSGSMGALAEPLANTAYIVGNGVQLAGGTFAQVAFGHSTSSIVKAGRRVEKVPYVAPHDPREDPRGACLALDAELDLVEGDGIRILMIASDGQYVVREQREWCDKFLPYYERKGVIVLLLDFEGGAVAAGAGGYYNTRHNVLRDPVVIDPYLAPEKIAALLGDIIVKEVAKEQARRSGI